MPRSMRNGLTPLRGELGSYEVGKMSNSLHGLEFRSLELDLEPGFYSHDQVDVIERIPLRNVSCGQAWAQLEAFVIEDISKDLCELVLHFLLLH